MSVLSIRRYGVKYMTPYEQREFVRRLYTVVGRSGVLHKSRQEGEAKEAFAGNGHHGGGTSTAPPLEEDYEYRMSRGD